jgi:hypothetical protein
MPAQARRAGVWPRIVAALMAACTAPQAQAACATAPGHPSLTACLHQKQGWPRYGHGVLGDTPEWSTLRIRNGGRVTDISQPGHIFEDVSPRFADLTGDGRPELFLVQSSFGQGARLVVYDPAAPGAPIAATPYIGQPNRWLAPVGVADLDGDGRPELAFVDRPHLRRSLRIWRYESGALQEVAALAGVTNHRIGDAYFSGGIRRCGDRPELVLLSPDWRRLLAIRLTGGRLTPRDIGPNTGAASISAAMACSAQD